MVFSCAWCIFFKHLGSIAFGAAIMTVVKIIKIVLEGFNYYTKDLQARSLSLSLSLSLSRPLSLSPSLSRHPFSHHHLSPPSLARRLPPLSGAQDPAHAHVAAEAVCEGRREINSEIPPPRLPHLHAPP